jgi:hypothetical protein
VSHREHRVMSKYVSVSGEKRSFFSCILLSQFFFCIYLRDKFREMLGTIQFRIFHLPVFEILRLKYKNCNYHLSIWVGNLTSLSLSKEFRFRVFQNKVLKWTSRPMNRKYEEERENYIKRSFIICRFHRIAYHYRYYIKEDELRRSFGVLGIEEKCVGVHYFRRKTSVET